MSNDYGSVILRELERVYERRKEINKNSKYHIGQRVRVTSHLEDLLEHFLMLGESIPFAKMKANYFLCNVYEVQSVDELIDDITREKGKYYTIEDEAGYLYLFPEKLISDYEGEYEL